jgi:hypothetical protein
MIIALIAAAIFLTRNWSWETTAQLKSRLAPLRRLRKPS